ARTELIHISLDRIAHPIAPKRVKMPTGAVRRIRVSTISPIPGARFPIGVGILIGTPATIPRSIAVVTAERIRRKSGVRAKMYRERNPLGSEPVSRTIFAFPDPGVRIEPSMRKNGRMPINSFNLTGILPGF
ncbi:MAG TPA: hypothetical protein VKO45_04755, partial [Methanomicrobiales archaeon]|nr:hypothetical protein [Methanomicrobiales archaeon]